MNKRHVRSSIDVRQTSTCSGVDVLYLHIYLAVSYMQTLVYIQ